MILKSIFEINSEIFIFFTYKGPRDLKEVTIIMERLLSRSLTTILKIIFKIRKESK